MAARGSFQKRQKEAERREKRQLKLDRRQGRQPARHTPSETVETENPTTSSENLDLPKSEVTAGS
jgi:hypothetical protein